MNLDNNRIPFVSVIMITFNHEQFIAQAIEGVLMQQTEFEVELIIADDASPDNTHKIIDSYVLNHPRSYRIKYFRHSSNLGMVYNFSWAWQQCKGRYIALCEGDDYWTDPLKLQKQVDFLEKNAAYSMVFHQVEKLFETGYKSLFNDLASDCEIQMKDLIKKNFIATGSSLFRHLGDDLPDWFKQLPSGDWGLHLYNASRGKVYYHSDCMGVYRIHNKGAWSKLTHYEMIQKGVEVLKLLDKGFDYKYHEEFSEAIDSRLGSLTRKKRSITDRCIAIAKKLGRMISA